MKRSKLLPISRGMLKTREKWSLQTSLEEEISIGSAVN